MDRQDRDWNRRHAAAPPPAPDPWLVAHAALLALARSPVLDLACGLGQNALWLAAKGLRVTGVDASPQAVHRAQTDAAHRRLPATFEVLDLESGGPFPGGPGHWGGIAVFHYLRRELFPCIQEALAPAGFLVYKTHLAHRLRPPGSRPRRPEFLLRPGELLAAFPALHLLAYREWAEGSSAFAALVARRPAHSS